MSWRNVKLIFLREVRDQLRDRRTLFMVAVLPILLYPALGIGMMQMTLLFSEQPRNVVILGAKNLPPTPALIRDGRFLDRWFSQASSAEKLDVLTDLDELSPDPLRLAQQKQMLSDARRIEEKRREQALTFARLQELEKLPADSRPAAEIQQLLARENELKTELSRLFAESGIQVLLSVPDGFQSNVEHAGDRAANGETSGNYEGIHLITNRADDKAQLAASRVKVALDAWEVEILRERLRKIGLHENFATPVNAEEFDLAQDHELSATVWSKVFPALLVLMSVTGAFYPAVDVAAGEKERGTMETLLICPASRGEIVGGKFLTVLLFSMSTALLNMVSMGITGKYMSSVAAGTAMSSRMGDLALPGPLTIFWVLALLVPLSTLFSALCLSLATFARSTKEGQYYLTPLLMVTLGLTLFCLSPGIEIQPFYSILPVMGPALLLRQLIANPGDAAVLVYAVPVLLSSIGYSMLAMWWAIDQFAREDVLFREAERFDIGLWFKHLMRDKEEFPSFSEAALCFLMIMFLQFGSMKFMQQALGNTADGIDPVRMIQLLLLQQLVIIACPALFMGLLLTSSFRRTFRLKLPSLPLLLVAAALPVAIHPISVELQRRLAWFFPNLPPGVSDTLASMNNDGIALWFLLLGFAVAPAICEEIAFRGFILSGLNSKGRTGVAIVISSLCFGLMHMIPQQIFNATLLGLVLGLLAVRSRSLLPCVVFHFVNNALAVLHARYGDQVPDTAPANWFFRVEPAGLSYQWPTLIVAAAVVAVLLRWVNRQTGDLEISEPMRETAELPPLPASAP